MGSGLRNTYIKIIYSKINNKKKIKRNIHNKIRVHSHLFWRKILHTSCHAVAKNSEIPRGERGRVLTEIVEILPGAVITQVRQQFPVHHVLEYKIMRLCEQAYTITQLNGLKASRNCSLISINSVNEIARTMPCMGLGDPIWWEYEEVYYTARPLK